MTQPAREIVQAGAELRDACEEVDAMAQATAQRTACGVTATLSRAQDLWLLTLRSATGAIAPHCADLWAAAVGAPSLDWQRTRQGRCYSAQWAERTHAREAQP